MNMGKFSGIIMACLRISSLAVFMFLLPLLCQAQEEPEKKAIEISAGWGYSPAYSMIELHLYDGYSSGRVDLAEISPVSDKYTLNPVSVEVVWPMSKKWDVGGGITYNQIWQKFVEGSVTSYFFTAEAIIRYNIIKRDYFRLYASACGGPFVATRVERTDNPSRYTESVFIPAEFYVGLSGGKRLFGFCEIGLGTRGGLRGGLGYRLNTSEQ